MTELKIRLQSVVAGAICNAVITFGALAGVIDVTPGEGALGAALAQAQPGDKVRLSAGEYFGPVVIKKPLTLIGLEGASVNGQSKGSVITIDAPDVAVSTLIIIGSGSSHQENDAGVKLTRKAVRAVVEKNRLLGNLVGVDIHGAVDARVANNIIEGRLDHRMNDRGNGVYLWNAPGAIVEGNEISGGRDGIFVNSSLNNIFRNNRMENLRFAIHYMYANDSEVTGNISIDNHLGFALMFSSGLVVSRNISIGDRDHGIMLNFANGSRITENIVRNGGNKCLFMYNANKNVLFNNQFEACRIGIHFTAGSERNEVYGNAFIRNRTQVKYVGTADHIWSADGVGNFWSDHAAFDIDGDGVADQAFRPNGVIDHILWTQPAAELLMGSPAVQLVRWAQSSFPSLLPGGVIDPAPLMRPLAIEPVAGAERRLIAGAR